MQYNGDLKPGMPTSKLRKLYSESQKSVFFHKNLYFLIWCQISLLNLNPRVKNCYPKLIEHALKTNKHNTLILQLRSKNKVGIK